MAVAKRQQRFDLSGTWNLTETEGIDGFIADLNMSEPGPPACVLAARRRTPLSTDTLATASQTG
jgi:hypothetical protein